MNVLVKMHQSYKCGMYCLPLHRDTWAINNQLVIFHPTPSHAFEAAQDFREETNSRFIAFYQENHGIAV